MPWTATHKVRHPHAEIFPHFLGNCDNWLPRGLSRLSDTECSKGANIRKRAKYQSSSSSPFGISTSTRPCSMSMPSTTGGMWAAANHAYLYAWPPRHHWRLAGESPTLYLVGHHFHRPKADDFCGSKLPSSKSAKSFGYFQTKVTKFLSMSQIWYMPLNLMISVLGPCGGWQFHRPWQTDPLIEKCQFIAFKRSSAKFVTDKPASRLANLWVLTFSPNIKNNSFYPVNLLLFVLLYHFTPFLKTGRWSRQQKSLCQCLFLRFCRHSS